MSDFTRNLTSDEARRNCHWCEEWDHVAVPATAKYLPLPQIPWVYVCENHLLGCGPRSVREEAEGA